MMTTRLPAVFTNLLFLIMVLLRFVDIMVCRQMPGVMTICPCALYGFKLLTMQSYGEEEPYND